MNKELLTQKSKDSIERLTKCFHEESMRIIEESDAEKSHQDVLILCIGIAALLEKFLKCIPIPARSDYCKGFMDAIKHIEEDVTP